jgi:hypothetical protein
MPLGEVREPVPGFGIRFAWQTGEWEKIFDAQIELIRNDVQRALLDGKIVVYLSCPISGKGGGHAGTNVEIAKFTERRLLSEWGERFWILNPAQYQLESKEGFGLLDVHARNNGIDLKALLKRGADDPRESVGGGDYMRMWTKVLVEDSPPLYPIPPVELRNLGRNFDAYYFLGPTDVRAFFGASSQPSVGASIEQYFSRKHSFDRAFRDFFSPEKDWELNRRAFLVYYSLRAGAGVSLGSHDEWQILRLLNQARRKVADTKLGGIPNQIAAFFDGRALPMSTAEGEASLGYAR